VFDSRWGHQRIKMFKIPASYYLRQAMKSDTIEDAVQNYANFYDQMFRQTNWMLEKYDDAWKKFFDNAQLTQR
jgi:hypothetical protein